MSEPTIEFERLRQQSQIEREKIKAGVQKVIYGTLLLGVAVALFPVISGAIENYYKLKVEEVEKQNSLDLQQNQLNLDLRKLTRENELEKAAAKDALEQSDREYFETIADEARSSHLSDRITLAEFFAYLSRDDSERRRWEGFLTYLKIQQNFNNSRRVALLQIIADSNKSDEERAAATRELRQIDERENGTAAVGSLSKWQEQVPIPDAKSIGASSLTLFTQATFTSLMGPPTTSPKEYCTKIDNTRFSTLIRNRSIGPTTITLIAPALESLESILGKVALDHPDLFAEIKIVGSLCIRFKRGSTRDFSNHSWGTAVDLAIGTSENSGGDNTVDAGLAELAKYFAKEGWKWGGNFSRPDPMHFEVSAEKINDWNTAGMLGKP